MWNSNLFKTALRHGLAFIGKNAPWILMGLGTCGFAATTVWTAKATPKAIAMKQEAEKEKGEELTKWETVKSCWKPYAPAALLGLASLACFFGAHGIHLRRSALLASAYTVAEKKLSEYQDKVTETIGEKQEKDIRTAIAKDHLNHRKDEIIGFATGSDTFPVLDEYTGQIFASSKLLLKDHFEPIFQNKVRGFMEITLNEWLQEIGERPVSNGNSLVWTEDEGFEIEVKTCDIDVNGKPMLCYDLDYRIPPRERINMRS